MNLWLILSVNSVTLGGLLFLLSAGFSLIFGLMRIPNLTHGSMFMLVAYLGVTFIAAGIAFSAFGFLAQSILTAPRVYFAMAQDRAFFRVNRRRVSTCASGLVAPS